MENKVNRPGALMAAEMAEQPGVLAALLERRAEIASSVRALGEPAGVVLVARGSSDNAAIYGRYLLEPAVGRPVSLAAPSLFTLYDARVDYSGWLAIALSQSGATPEIVDVFARMRAAGARGVAITNDESSPLAEEADAVVALGAGEELAVPATKTFLPARGVRDRGRGARAGPVGHHGGPAGARRRGPRGSARAAAEEVGDAVGMIAVGRGYLFAIALEAALKLKETALLHAEGLSAADFRHGPIAIMEHGFPVLALSAEGAAARDMADLEQRLRGRAPLLRLAPDPSAALPIPAGIPEALTPIVAVVRAQQLALEVTLARGLTPTRRPGCRR